MHSELSFKMDLWIEKNYNVILEGKHGVGKTEIIKQKFEEHKLNWLYFSASTMDPWVDFIGIPREKKENGIEFTELVRPKYLAEDSIDAIFLDEYNRAPKKIRNATMELIQFKSINGKKFNRLKFIWVAINPEDDESEYDVEKLDDAQRDRFQIYYKVPYAVSIEYFHKKYGEKGVIGIKWWNALEDDKKKLISPRRLDYCLDYYNSNGDLGDICNPEINYHSLITQLENGIYSEKLLSLFNSKDDAGSVEAFKSENFYNATIQIILKDVNLMAYFVDKLPKEKTVINITTNYPFAIAASNKLNYFDLEDSLNNIIENGKVNSKIQEAISRWKKSVVIPVYIKEFKEKEFSIDLLMKIISVIQNTQALQRNEILEELLFKMKNSYFSKEEKGAVILYLSATTHPSVKNKYKEIVKEIISDSSVNNLDEAIMEMENLCLELTIKYKIYDRRFGDIHSLFY